MTKYYTDKTIDTDIKVFFNVNILPIIPFAIFDSIYGMFVLYFIMVFFYEFVVMDKYYNLYTDEELEVKRNTLNLSYVMYTIFFSLFWEDIVSYLS